ncbi:hypothetical protein STRDD11_01200 [Streptococcus sp. DD11]|uniref:hypothetical protein n=1 Tax=Streptococcus sp. DD11 TaxID=1777879 RepID=UPI000795A452|nr:hypothetical protein [Streptococcus sp. DD11]KXT83947.1 hypothetical protein STRDD11_01200 [Streptococcus sp. DD11]
MKKILKTIIIILGGFIVMTNLSGCRYLEEQKFSDLGKVYPTKNPYDLFKVFPKGFRIYNSQLFNKTNYVLDLYSQESGIISGTLEINEINETLETVVKIDIEVDKTGKLMPSKNLTGKYQEWLENFIFLFQIMDLSQEQLRSFKENGSYRNAIGDYTRLYILNDSRVASYLKIQGTEFGISIHGNTDYEKQFDFYREVEIGRDDSSIKEFITSGGGE